jgi:hypothetical protein
MESTKNSEISYILKIVDWDADLPTGDWSGPDPQPLYPSIERAIDPKEAARALREVYIHFHPTKEQNLKILDWVNLNIPEDIKWLFPGLEVDHVQFPKLFLALPSVHCLKEEENFQHPEVLKDDWDTRLDACRSHFLQYLAEIGCAFQFVTENEAIDNGMLNIKGYDRPSFINSHDTYIYPGNSNPPKKLWKYLTTTKFLGMLQNQSVWFSRPQFFDDPHEFTMDVPSQRNLFQWKLNSFARAYNRAVVSKQTSFISTAAPLVAGLEVDESGKIKNGQIRLSQLSSSLLSSIKKDIRTWQESFCISCWRYSPYDSVAIWNQYATLNEGVAIVADLDGLRKSFQKIYDIRLTIIEYRDFADETIAPMSMNPLTYKDIRFSSEEEARFYFRARLGSEKGLGVPFELADVITEIHLSPNSDYNYKQLVRGLLENYGLNIAIVESSLSRVPSKF